MQRVGEYILQTRIGQGAFGEVWRAQHHVWADRVVAVKIPRDPNYIRDLQREGSAIHGLVHPNIVRALAFDPYAPTPYLAMEYVPGTSLRPLIQSKTIGPQQAVNILRQVLIALQYAHQRNIVHLDVKPENVLVHEQAPTLGYATIGMIKLTDFGFGRTARAASAQSIVYSTSVDSDHAASIVGTVDYMSPEMKSGAQPDARADLYACGVMLFEMLTNERPAGTEVPSDVRPGLPRALDEIFRRSYSRIERRYESADQFMQALDSAMPSQASRPMPPPIPGTQPHSVQSTTTPLCTRCGSTVYPEDQFCMNCGLQRDGAVIRCRSCGAFPQRNDRYCIHCGHDLAWRDPAATPSTV